MSNCIEKLPHECGSSDGLQVFENDGKFDGFCFRCETWVPDPYKDKPKGYSPPKTLRPNTQEMMDEAYTLPFPKTDIRSLKPWAFEHFGVRVALSEEDGVTPIATYFPYASEDDPATIAWKIRLIKQKKMWAIGDLKSCTLFGWHQALRTGAKTLYITEGEYDAIALFQALKEKSRGTQWEKYDPAVVSLKAGATSTKRDLPKLAYQIGKNFEGGVVLVYDQDEAGEAAVKATVEVLRNCRSCGTLPAKDPNECIQKGFSKGLATSVLFRNSVPKNSRLVDLRTLMDQAKVPPEWGWAWPWDGMTELTRGIRPGETYYIGAGVKMGKSELVNALATHLNQNEGLKILMAKPEEANVRSTKKIAGKLVGGIFHDPKVKFDDEAFSKAEDKFRYGEIFGIDLYQHIGWETLRMDIVEACQLGVRVVFIDPITNLTNGLPASEANSKLQEIAEDLAAMAKDFNIAVFIFCHLKAPDSGEPHERGGQVYSNQFAGSRAMMRSCNYMMSLEGNKDKTLTEYERNMRELVILEDREFGEVGSVKLYWDKHTQLFNEIKK